MSRFGDRLATAWRVLRGERSYFAGAQQTRLTLDWAMAPMVSGREEWRSDGNTLRARGREMVRNDPTFARYVTLLADQVVGPRGVIVEPRLYDAKGTLLKDASRALGAAFAAWSGRGTCTRDGRSSLAELAHTVMRLRPQDGEVLVQLVPGDRNRWGLTLQLVDPDLLRFDLNAARSATTNEVVNGVELDSDGRPVRYHLWEDYRRERTVAVSAEWMLHLFRPRRPNDARGICEFAPVMMLARMLHGYREAEVVAARVASMKVGAVSVDPQFGPVTLPTDPQTGATVPAEAEPGSFFVLPPGHKLDLFDPTHPSEAFDPFVRSVKGDIAIGLGHAAVTLFGDWSQTNYSSGRMPVMQERDRYRVEQQWLIDALYRPVYERWLQLAWLKGAIQLPTNSPRNHMDAVYRPRTWPMFDPKEEVEIARDLLDLRLTTRTKVSADLGLGEWEDTLEQTDAEQELAAAYGVTLDPVAPAEGPTTEEHDATEAESDADIDADRGRAGLSRGPDRARRVA